MRAWWRLGVEVAREKPHHLHGGAHTIGGLAPAVSFVRKQNVVNRDAALLKVGDDLLGFHYEEMAALFGVKD